MPPRGLPLCALLLLGSGCVAVLPPAPPTPYLNATAEPGEPAVVGQVRNARTGEGFAGVLLVLTDRTTGAAREALSSAGGLYRFSGLHPGEYEIRMLFDDDDLRWPLALAAATRARVDFVVRPRIPCFGGP